MTTDVELTAAVCDLAYVYHPGRAATVRYRASSDHPYAAWGTRCGECVSLLDLSRMTVVSLAGDVA